MRNLNPRLVAAGVVSGALLVPLAVFGAPALARTGSAHPAAAQYEYGPTGAAAPQGKVTLCHRTHSKKSAHQWVLISIGAAAVNAHLRIGDKYPPCTNGAPVAPTVHGKPSNGATGNSGYHGKPSFGTTGTTGNNGHHGKP
jgi:hypothetical protein